MQSFTKQQLQELIGSWHRALWLPASSRTTSRALGLLTAPCAAQREPLSQVTSKVLDGMEKFAMNINLFGLSKE